LNESALVSGVVADDCKALNNNAQKRIDNCGKMYLLNMRLFDNIDHQLLMKAVKKHTDNKWIILYIERWLVTPMQLPDGTLQEKARGVMQGGVISPVLSNFSPFAQIKSMFGNGKI